jgi:hypothetical protein
MDGLYYRLMNKYFKVVYIAETDDEANEYTKTHKDAGVIAEDNINGLIYIAEIKETK